MAKYTFRLRTLLKLRDAVRNEQRQALALAHHEEEILRRRRGEIEDELDQLDDATRQDAAPGSVDVVRLLESRRYHAVLRARGQRVDEEQEALSGTIEQRRRALVEADRGVRVLENLRDRQQARHRLDQQRQENKTLDESTHARLGLRREPELLEKETDAHG